MPFTKGTISLRRYTLPPPPPNLLDVATLAIRRYSWRPINDERGEIQSSGWINPRQILQTTFSVDELLDRGQILLALRQDNKRLNHTLFHARLRQRIDQVCKERRLTKLSRQHRLLLEDEVRLEMMREQSPVTAFCELLWDLHANTLTIASPTNLANDLACEIFINTFDLRPVRSTGLPLNHDGSNPVGPQVQIAGTQFLTWLLAAVLHDSIPVLPSFPTLQVHMEGPLVFVHPEHQARKITILGENAPTAPEANAALQAGKLLQSATLILTEGEETWRLTLDATTLTLKSVRLPVPALPDLDEYIYLRTQSLAHLQSILDQLIEHHAALTCGRRA